MGIALRAVLPALACLAVSGAAWAGADITTLTVTEQVGAARTNEPIRMGVPLAKGVAKGVTELSLADATGKPIPSQFVEVMRWPEDNSLRWVHVIFQASVGAKGKTTVKLMKGAPAAGTGKLDVAEADGTVTVTNGVLKLVVKGANFNVIDAAWYDPTGAFGPGTEIVKPHNEGIVAMLDGKARVPGADTKVIVEEKGPEGVVIRASGKLVANAESPFEFVCRIHVFRASPVVKVDFSYTNASGKVAADKVMMEDLSLVVPTALAGAKATVGAEQGAKSGTAAKIVATTSDLSELTVAGTPAGTAKGKSSKPFTIGWVDLTQGQKGLAVGVRWFWQMFPKAMEASADGKLRAGLYAREVGKPLEVYMGQARTHYLTFLFHGAMADADLSTFFAGTQMPLRAVASSKYYCRDAQGFGPVADSDPSIYPADVADAMKKFDEAVKASAVFIEKKIDGCTFQRVTLDSYGYYAWGDVFHYAKNPGATDPWNILWESNYYDYPWTAGLQFARTGDLLYLDILDRHGLNLADVFMCHWTPEKMYCGACRYSPPANFVGLDSSTAEKPQPYFSVEFNHHKAQSILARYYLLGDLRAKDDFLLALNNAMLNREQDKKWGQCRGPGAKLATLYSGYLLTRDPKCLEWMKVCVAGALAVKNTGSAKGFSTQGSSGNFMMGIASEGLAYHWWLTGDQDTLDTIKLMADYQLTDAGKKGTVANAACSMALMYRQTGDEKYKADALELLKPHQEERPKGFGQSWRSTAYAWYYLSNVGEKKEK